MWHHRCDVAPPTWHYWTLILSFQCQEFYLSYSYTSPHIHLWIFETLKVIISWVWTIHKRLNVNCKIIHSIILSVTCHFLRNFPLFIHIPPYPFVNFQNPMGYFWVWVIRKRLNVNWKKNTIILSVTCHSLRNFAPLIHIPSYPFMNFWNPMIDYFFEFESFIKGWMWIGKIFTQ